jgi:hypothetical protein
MSNLAFVAAVPLVLGEAYVLINFVMKSFIFGQAGIDLFDTVRSVTLLRVALLTMTLRSWFKKATPRSLRKAVR